MLTSATIKAQARELGFDACGIAPAADHPELAFFDEWLARGYAGDDGLSRRARPSGAPTCAASCRRRRRSSSPRTLYNTDRPVLDRVRAIPERAHIARYAWGDDYHDVIGARLDALLAWMRDGVAEPFEARAYVDTGPVQERVYAQHAGIGWIGKNTCVINPELGSWMFLGEIICSLPLEPDAPALDQCGTCTLCLEACPTQALVAPGVLDATRCISYLTIEHRGDDSRGARSAAIGAHVYGCDVCQEVCPWNAPRRVSTDPAWQPRPAWDRRRRSDDSAALTDDELREALRGQRDEAGEDRRDCAATSRSPYAHAIARPGDPCRDRDVRRPAVAGDTDGLARREHVDHVACLARRRRCCCRCRSSSIRTSTAPSSCCASTARTARSASS